MNKKFSTLMAALMVAGAWTTTDAKVVSITKPVVGGTYLIAAGTVTQGEGDDGKVEKLFSPTVAISFKEVIPINSIDSAWVFEAVENEPTQFYLKNSKGKYLGVSGSADKNTALVVKNDAIKFTWDSDKKKIKVVALPADAKGSTIAPDEFLLLSDGTVTTTNASGTELKYGSYSEDAYEGLPGLENVRTYETTTTEGIKYSGLIDIVTLETDEDVKAPMYIFNGDNKPLAVKYDATAKKYTVEALEAVTASKSLSASWRWEKGKLYSVAAEREREKKVVLKVTDDGSLNYDLVEDAAQGTEFTPTAEGLKVSDKVAITRAMVSATSLAAAPTITVAESGVIVDGKNLKLCTGIPSDYCIITLSDGTKTSYLYADATDGTVTTADFSATDDGYWWKVTRKAAGDNAFNYTFTSRAVAGNKAIVWQGNGTTTFVAATGALNGLTLASKDMSVQATGTLDEKDGIKGIVAFYEAPTAAKTQAQLNTLLNPGFEMTVKISENGKEVIEGIDVFGVKMYPFSNTSDDKTVKLWNNKKTDAKDAKILVLDKTITNKDNANVNGAFKWITETELNKNEANYLTDFQFRYSSGKPSNTAIIDQLVVMNKDGLTVYGAAYILPVQNNTTYYLTALTAISDDSKLPYIKLEASNILDVKQLLGKYLTFSYADTKANAKDDEEEYKYEGVLAVINEDGTNVADYVSASTVLMSSPEVQWAVVEANLSKNTVTLQNRENSSVKVLEVQLRHIEGEKFIAINKDNSVFSSDLIILGKTEVKKGKINFDGFMQTTPNALRNQDFYLGQYHAIAGNNHAYFAENHTDKASHQIGMTAEKEEAQKWNLHFGMKEDEEGNYTQVDTVFVYTTFATLKDGEIVTSGKDALADTLAILPYAFQNTSNREFVSYKTGTGFKFYYCNPDNLDNSNQIAERFALKMKPNNTYNFVRIAKAVTGEYAAPTQLSANKVYVANSADKGSLKNMLTYAPDQNSLMVVEKAEAPEYHKIAQLWGDTIKLFREENNAQVLYEKADAKSVVEKETLSFLNIDNVNQFKVNPAIFADTAFINRVVDGEQNTCYQYLLAVNVDPEKSYYCPYNTEHNSDEWREANGGPCADAKEHRAVYGRFLINLIDTANVYGVEHIHNNPYINEVEAGEKLAKLSFVEGVHADDTLYVTRKGGEVVKIAMDTVDFNVAKFAFRYVDNSAKTFKIQTQYKPYIPGNADAITEGTSNEGYLKWINGTVVVTNGFENGDVFGIEENYAGNPTANDEVTVSGISVVSAEGAVIIKGAEGKKVSISNILGQTIANTVITSSEATIAAPAGVVVVAVEGEAAVKAIVK